MDWEAIARGSQVIVIYMGMKHLDKISAALMAAGGRDADEPVALVTNATAPEQEVLETTLGGACVADVAASGMQPPAMICVGGRAALLRQALDWQSMAAGDVPRNPPDPLGRGRPAEER